MGWLRDLYHKLTNSGNEIGQRIQEDMKNIWLDEWTAWTYVPLSPLQVGQAADLWPQKVESGKSYLTVHLKSFNLVNSRVGWARYYGAVHSFISLSNRAYSRSTVGTVISPNKLLENDPAHADRVIVVNRPLFGPVPYSGGNLEIEMGLFAVKSADLARPYLDLLQEMSSVAGVNYALAATPLSAATPFIEPLKKGIELIAGSGDTVLEIGLETAPKPMTGWWLLMRAPAGIVDTSQCSVTGDDFRLLGPNGKPISDYPYIIFEITASQRNEEWYDIPELKAAYNALRDAVRTAVTETQKDEAKEEARYLIRLIKTSPDLVEADARFISREIVRWYQEAITSEPELMARINELNATLQPQHHLPELKSLSLYGDERKNDKARGWVFL